MENRTTKGQEALSALCRTRTGYSIAAALDTVPDSIYSWVKGTRRPTTHFRVALERLFNIPAKDWMTDDERRIAFGEPVGGEAAE